jgi:PBP1b-binding outer membrane lipoprotein LpoB
MDRFEKGEANSKIIPTYIVLLVAAFILASCSEQEEPFTHYRDQGSDEISLCPSDYSLQHQPIRYSASSYDLQISRAVGILSTQMPQNIRGEFLVHFDNETSADSLILSAGEAIFHKKAPDEFKVQSSETKIDDRSEQLCRSGADLYPTAQAETSMQTMKAAGINLKALHR